MLFFGLHLGGDLENHAELVILDSEQTNIVGVGVRMEKIDATAAAAVYRRRRMAGRRLYRRRGLGRREFGWR